MSAKEREQFVKAIRQDPGDLTTRKIFADWLDEHDEPEEADKQRGYTVEDIQEAEDWLTELAEELGSDRYYSDDHDDWHRDDGPRTLEQVISLGYFALKHNGYSFGSDHEADVMRDGDTTEKFWKYWEVLTVIPVLNGPEFRDLLPRFHCGC